MSERFYAHARSSNVGVAGSKIYWMPTRTYTLGYTYITKMATGSSSSKSKKQKRQVSLATFRRWQTEKEKEYQTLSWLRCDKANQSVELLRCASCRKFEDKI